MKLTSLLMAILALSAGCRPGNTENGQSKPAVPISGFVNRSLAQTVADAGVSAGPDGTAAVPGDQRCISRVTYVGQTRPVGDSHRTALRTAEKKTGTVALSDDVKNEFLFREAGTDYWMPVGAKTELGFKSLPPGRAVDLYASLVAVVTSTAGASEPVFVAQDYLEVGDR